MPPPDPDPVVGRLRRLLVVAAAGVGRIVPADATPVGIRTVQPHHVAVVSSVPLRNGNCLALASLALRHPRLKSPISFFPPTRLDSPRVVFPKPTQPLPSPPRLATSPISATRRPPIPHLHRPASRGDRSAPFQPRLRRRTRPGPPPLHAEGRTASRLVGRRRGGFRSAGDMLGELLSKILLLLFGYAMPAFECFKTVEARPNDAHMLRFWCQYWIIVAMVIAFESVISWMPMFSEMKLAFFVYLWYPKTKGSDVVYDTFLRPIVMQYEPNIEQRLLHLRAKSGQLLSFYVKNFADKGTAFFMDVLRYVVSEKPEGSDAERNKKSGWSPFATRRRPPSPPPQESIFDSNPDAAVVAEALRATIGAKPRRAPNGKHY